jgi:ABC-type uncharacterized transport system permease subunit
MHEMSVLWLRVAAVLYAVGLLHAILTILKRRAKLFRLAFITFCGGLTLHFVSIVEEAAYTGHFPANNFYESISLCAYLIGLLYLLVYLRHHVETLSAFVFPLVFVMTLVGALGSPVGSWSDPKVRDTWLLAHVTLVLAGYAAMLLMAVASVAYLIQERQLKRKRASIFLDRLPPLGVLDGLISTSMAAGFLLITLAVIAGSIWAFIESARAGLLNRRSWSPGDLGLLPAAGVPARFRRLAWAQGRVDVDCCTGMLGADTGPRTWVCVRCWRRRDLRSRAESSHGAAEVREGWPSARSRSRKRCTRSRANLACSKG